MSVTILKSIKTAKNQGSHRQARVASLIKNIIAEIIHKFDIDLGLNGDKFIGIANVKVSPDLHNVTIYVTVFPESFSKEIVTKLNLFANKIRAVLCQKIELKYSPQLTFRYDDTMENVGKINNLLVNLDKA